VSIHGTFWLNLIEENSNRIGIVKRGIEEDVFPDDPHRTFWEGEFEYDFLDGNLITNMEKVIYFYLNDRKMSDVITGELLSNNQNPRS
jgi:hypothetical protein